MRLPDLPLFNYEIELDLRWTKNCLILEILRATPEAGNANANPPTQAVAVTQKTGTTFKINNAKLYFPVVTLSIIDNIKYLENTKQGFKRTISWNKYRSEITTQPKIDNLDYLTDPAFKNINGLFAISFRNGDDDPTRNSFDEYYTPLIEIKDFNALIDYKSFFD